MLDVSVVDAGYSTEHFMFSPFWRPDAMVRASLVLRTAGERLYEERIMYMYGYHNMFISAVKLDTPKKYQFADQDALNAADDATLIDGLKDASRRIAARIAGKMLELQRGQTAVSSATACPKSACRKAGTRPTARTKSAPPSAAVWAMTATPCSSPNLDAGS